MRNRPDFPKQLGQVVGLGVRKPKTDKRFPKPKSEREPSFGGGVDRLPTAGAGQPRPWGIPDP